MSTLDLNIDDFESAPSRSSVAARGRHPASRLGSTAWPELDLLAGIGHTRQCGSYRIRTLEAPGQALSACDAVALRAMCVRASSLAFGVDLDTYWRTRPDYFGAMSEWSVVDRDGDLAGWHGIVVWHGGCGTVIYTDMLATLPAHRRTGLGAFLGHDAWLRVARRHRCLPIASCRTQNPVVMRMMGRFATTTYPRPDGAATGRHYGRAAEAAQLVASQRPRGTAPAEGTFVVRNALPAALCNTPPTCRDARIDTFFDQLDVASGDAVIVIGMVSPAGAVRAVVQHAALRMHLSRSLHRAQAHDVLGFGV